MFESTYTNPIDVFVIIKNNYHRMDVIDSNFLYNNTIDNNNGED